MSLARDFARAVGTRVAHFTAAENLYGIEREGLYPAAKLANDAGSLGEIALRSERVLIQGQGVHARLNHQRPILDGLGAAKRMIDGYNPGEWAAQLDQRVFLWPECQGKAFAASVKKDLPSVAIWLDAGMLAERFADIIDLAPINTGNFRQGGAHARRGDWIYFPLTGGIEAFRTERQRRRLVGGRDVVREISLRGGIPVEDLRFLRVE